MCISPFAAGGRGYNDGETSETSLIEEGVQPRGGDPFQL
jgi:hypothetical protein